jgi:hypothetical protein
MGDVLHHEEWPEKPDDADEFFVEAVAPSVESVCGVMSPNAERSFNAAARHFGDELVRGRGLIPLTRRRRAA